MLHVIEKQQLLAEDFSTDALKLAKAIYNTYIEDEKLLFMQIKTETMLHIFELSLTQDSINYIKSLFEELNEPICVKNFKFYNDIYPMRFMTFCTYSIDDENIEIELNEEFLHAEENYMLDPFLKG